MPSEDCQEIKKTIDISNIAFGFFGFMFALGFYLLFFNKTEEKIIKKIEDDNKEKSREEKLKILMLALDPFEKKVIEAVNEQNGITQNTLKLRVNMSKAKLSYVLKELENRNLIKRMEKGKTLEVWLRV